MTRTARDRATPDRRRPVRIALLYGIGALAWILVTDLGLAAVLGRAPLPLVLLGIVKGGLFALATAGLFYLLLRREYRRLEAARRALSASELRFRDFAGLVPDWFWETDLDQCFTLFHGGKDAAGRPPGFQVGRTRREVIAEEGGNPAVCDVFADLMARGEAFPGIVYSLRGPQGGRRWLQVFGRPVHGEDGRIVAYRGTTSDITERWEAEMALQEAIGAADAAARSKSDFLGNLSHELRTPLNAILGFAQIMSRGTFGPIAEPRYQGYLRDIQNSAQRLLDTINSLLDYAALRDGRMVLQDEPVAIAEVVDSVLLMLAEQAAAHGVRLSGSAPPTLPRVRADKLRLQQALLALVSNAIKFTPRGGEVSVHAAARGPEGVVLMVHDTGIGMSDADIPVALAPLERLGDPLTRRQEGVGIGLPLAKALVELHKGRMVIHSAPGRGTDVEIVLPPDRIVA